MTSEGHLGASEFAATLNGDNPQEILKVLKQFVRTIRRDRRLALSLEDQDSDQEDEESSDEEDVEQPPAKKLKKSEDWKEDTASYHVPFVGTSVAKSDAAEVVKGEWPTGLLKAYLMKSPLAIELTSDDLIAPEGQIHRSLVKRKKGKMSRDISKAYLLALAELVTAAIPARKLKDEEASASDTGVVDPDPAQFKFLPALLKKHLGSIFKLINDETDRGRGKQGVFGGCGSIAPPSLKLLQNISMISTTNARLIARYLDEELSDNVLKVLLRPPPPPKQPSENDAKERKVLSKHARVETINLATRLVQAEDSAVATYICTAGSRERKVKPGILYISFREGLASHSHSNVGTEADDNYLDAVADMLSGVRSILLNNSRVISHKQVVELLSRDPMNHLCQLVTHGPPLKPGNTFYDASIEGGESDQDLDVLENVGLEARRLLFPLLSNTSTSPFLHYVERDANWSKNYGQHLVRSLIHLLHVPNGGIQMRRFLAHCLKETPILLPGLFRTLTFPEPKKTFDFISSLNFVTTLLRCGPSPLTCLPLIGTQGNESDTSESLLTILPVKLKKHPLAKGLQSENPLIVLECLKLVLSALERFDALKSEGKLKRKWSDEYMENLSETFKHWLPDLQILLTVRTRHDAFLNRSKANVLISDCLYRVLEAFASVLPSSVRASKFDWMKMLPSSNTFSKAVPFVQRRVLKSLIKIIEACDVSTKSEIKVYSVSFIILTSTNRCPV